MRSTRNILPWVAAGAAVLSLPAAPRALEAQTSDLLILVAPVAVTEPVDRRFGERIAEEVRDALKIFPGYIAIERDDARDQIDDFDLDERTMTAIEWQQLGGQVMNAALVMVGTAVAVAGGVEVDVNFLEPRSGDQLPMVPFTVADDDSHQEAGAQIMAQLGQGVEYLRSLAFCGDYLASEQPMDAISNCNAALALNPDSDRAHYLRGRAYMLNEAWGDAVNDLQRVVDNNASDTDALESLAFTYAQLGDGAESLRYYQRFLDFRPDDIDTRLRIAYELTQAERWGETVQLLQDGVERAPDNVGLLEYLTAASLEAGQTDGAVTDPAMIRVAVDASGKLVDLQGDAVNPSTLSNATNAYMLLEEYDNALAFSDRALESISGSAGNGEGEMSREQLLAQVHSSRATIYDRMENPEMGVAELEQALSYDPAVPNGRQRLAQLKLKTGDTEGAVADFRAAVADGGDPNQIAQAIFSLAYTTHFEAQSSAAQSNPSSIDVGEVGTAVELFTVASEFVQDPAASEQMHFFIAFGYYLQGSAYDSRNEADEACAPARNALNAFQRVSTHLGQAGSHQAGSQQQIREAIDIQLYRQQSIIEASCDRS